MKAKVTVRKSPSGSLVDVPKGTQASDVIRTLARVGAMSVVLNVEGIEVRERTETSGNILRAIARETHFRIWVREDTARAYPLPRVDFSAEGLRINGRIVRASSPSWHPYLTAWPELHSEIVKRFGSWTTTT